MKLYMKEKVFSWFGHFDIYNEQQETVFTVEGDPAFLLKKLHLYGANGRELRYIHQQFQLFLMSFLVSAGEGEEQVDLYSIDQEFTFFKRKFTVNGLQDGTTWSVTGDFWDHNYSICDGDTVVATVEKAWISWGCCYEMDINEDYVAADVICCILAIDAAIHAANSAAASAST